MSEFKNEKRKLFDYLGKRLCKYLKSYDCIVAGGSINSIFNRKDINDIDVYFRNKEDLFDFIIEYCTDFDGIILSKTEKALLIKDSKRDILVQLIYFDYFEKAEDIFNTFDFTVCMAAYDFKLDKFVIHEDFLHHNTTRLLKFNEKTAYPIMSALRVQKYKEKGYDIPKADFVKIILTCMNLKINSFKELKEQIGGTYGVNVDKLFQEKFKDEDNINIIEVINAIVDAEDEYIKEKKITYLSEIDVKRLAWEVTNKNINYFKLNDDNILIYGSRLEECSFDVNNDIYVEISKEEALKDIVFCKWVRKTDDNKYFSNYDSEFEYKMNELTIPNGDKDFYGGYGNKIYCCTIDGINNTTYSEGKHNVLIELKVDVNDIIDIDDESRITVKKCIPIREVPKEEYKKSK